MWKWDPSTGTYVNTETGERFGKEEMLVFVAASILLTGFVADDLAIMIYDGLLDAISWRLALREQIKREYIRQYLLGIGGRSQMTAADWNIIGEMLKGQYQYLEGFVEALPELSEAQIASRSKMYINSARQAYESARSKVAIGLGYDEELWVLDVFAEHCPDCEEFAAMGWQPIGTFPTPGNGSTVCLSSCKCGKEYRNSETEEVWEG